MTVKVLENGKYREATAEELSRLNDEEALPYKDRVVARIREKYSVDDEIAVIRQRDTKPDEFNEYNAFVEAIKQEEKRRTLWQS